MGSRPTQIDQALVDEILGGDPLLTPGEAGAELGLSARELWGRSHPETGDIAAIRLPLGHRRYRRSVIAAAKARQEAE
jgi:hypothetical protein